MSSSTKPKRKSVYDINVDSIPLPPSISKDKRRPSSSTLISKTIPLPPPISDSTQNTSNSTNDQETKQETKPAPFKRQQHSYDDLLNDVDGMMADIEAQLKAM